MITIGIVMNEEEKKPGDRRHNFAFSPPCGIFLKDLSAHLSWWLLDFQNDGLIRGLAT